MIFGIGTDIVLISRIKNSKAFAEKILSASEMQLWEEKTSSKQQNFLAKQFACKEAVAKAIGTGFSNTIFPKDIEILRNSAGKPYINAQANLTFSRLIVCFISSSFSSCTFNFIS